MAYQLLLIKDVLDLGRSGDIVKVKSGFARNFLLPQGLAVRADKNALRIQEKLQVERRNLAAQDLKESEKLAKILAEITLTTTVKVDHEGHMYGSVSVLDVVNLLKEQHQIQVEKGFVLLKQPIKSIGIHNIPFKLKEAVETSCILKVVPEGGELKNEPSTEDLAKAEISEE